MPGNGNGKPEQLDLVDVGFRQRIVAKGPQTEEARRRCAQAKITHGAWSWLRSGAGKLCDKCQDTQNCPRYAAGQECPIAGERMELHRDLLMSYPHITEADFPLCKLTARQIVAAELMEQELSRRGMFSDDGELHRLEYEIEKIETKITHNLDRLGFSPSARKSLGLDVGSIDGQSLAGIAEAVLDAEATERPPEEAPAPEGQGEAPPADAKEGQAPEGQGEDRTPEPPPEKPSDAPGDPGQGSEARDA